MKTLIIKEINELKPKVIKLGFDYPLEANPNNAPVEVLKDFLAELKEFLKENL